MLEHQEISFMTLCVKARASRKPSSVNTPPLLHSIHHAKATTSCGSSHALVDYFSLTIPALMTTIN
jgi:hypothetical protein